MKLPSPRIFAVTAASLAIAVGATATATAASAATTQITHVSQVAPAAKAPGTITSSVTGTFTNSDGLGTFTGTFTPRRFMVVKGILEATGLLKGTLTDANGTTLGTANQTATTVVDTPQATADHATAACNSILDLTLGPLDLNLLGLVVTLNQIHLNITAVPGAGNLLGNLLCEITGLLNSGGSLSEISVLLNVVLALL